MSLSLKTENSYDISACLCTVRITYAFRDSLHVFSLRTSCRASTRGGCFQMSSCGDVTQTSGQIAHHRVRITLTPTTHGGVTKTLDTQLPWSANPLSSRTPYTRSSGKKWASLLRYPGQSANHHISQEGFLFLGRLPNINTDRRSSAQSMPDKAPPPVLDPPLTRCPHTA